MSIRKDPRGLKVVSVFDNSPAKRAGIHPQDVVVAVNGRSIAGEATNVASARIKGPAATLLSLPAPHPRTEAPPRPPCKRAKTGTARTWRGDGTRAGPPPTARSLTSVC